MDTTRRKFIRNTSLATLGLGLYACNQPKTEDSATQQTTQIPMSLPGIGLQLWTLRNAIEKDLQGTLDRIAAIGFKGVETAFWPEGVALKTAAEAMKKAGLQAFSIHCELPLDAERQDSFLAMSEAYDCDTLVWHGWPEDPRYASMEGLKALEAEYRQCAEFATKHGKQFGLHNHWWEFREIEGQTETPFEQLLLSLPEEIFFELDTYWIKVAGKDPAEMVQKWGDRAKLLHIKDGTGIQDQPMTAVGKGVQDFPAITAAAKENVEWLIVEIDDCATDMMTAVEESYRYLIDNEMGE